MKRGIFILVGIALIILGILGVFLAEKLQPPLEVRTITILSAGGTEPGDIAANFILESLNGTDIRLDRFAGEKSVILHFWSADAANELTQLQTVRNFYGDKVEILGIHAEPDVSMAKVTAKNMGLTFPVLLDPKAEVKQAYSVSILPTTYFVDSNGLIVDKKEGPLTEQELNEKIKRFLDKT